MVNPDTYASAVEGHVLPAVRGGNRIRCDDCTTPIEWGETVSIYFSTVDYTQEEIQDNIGKPARVYCNKCNTGSIRFPTTQAEEVLLEGSVLKEKTPIGEEWTFSNAEVADYSDTGNGIPWDPERIWSLLFGFKLRDFTHKSDYDNYTPEDVVVQLDTMAIHPKEIVNYKGELRKSSSELKKYRENLLENMDPSEFPWN